MIGGPDANGPSVNWRCDRTEVRDAVVGYRISRWDAATKTYQPLHSGLLPKPTRTYADITAARGATHFWTLEAVRADGTVAGTYEWSCVFQDGV